MSAQDIKEGIQYALAFATAGAGTSFSIKSFIPLPAIDAVPQALIIKTMAHQLGQVYGYSNLKGLTIFTGILTGSGSGMKVASELASLVPIAGASANAATSFALHMTTGISLIIVFELLQQKVISTEYIRNTTTSDITFLLGLASQVLADVLRGNDGIESTLTAVAKFKVPSTPTA
ncbi:hypothetical protein [Candidatus Oscillochloris fontis]|uniref:hypothetical protein n=1 Tax=Candidatus Oscillochloris fontis TaxID=2496868 RepID=UPI00101CAA3A|nr:hypothetical protein [Candidatus Oscillochloris fontis]